MKIKGNYLLMFLLQAISGLLTYYLCIKMGLPGILLGFIPFLIALILVQTGYKPDEREISILHKSNSYNGIITAFILAIVYLYFPTLNWFFIYIASISLVRGVIGMFLTIFN